MRKRNRRTHYAKTPPYSANSLEMQAFLVHTAYATKPFRVSVWVFGFMAFLMIMEFSTAIAVPAALETPMRICLGALALGVFGNVGRRQLAWSNLVEEMQNLGDPEAIPCLIDLATYNFNAPVEQAYRALRVLLPALTEEATRHFQRSHIAWLNSFLWRTAPDLRPEIVQALRYVGNAESARQMELILASEGLEATNYKLVETTRQCLPVLQARLSRAQESQTLLRASSEPVGSDTLLRPAYASPKEPEQELLRPAER